jgi:ribosome biogenesis GTPase
LTSSLALLGWDSAREAEFAPWIATGACPGRVGRPDRTSYLVLTGTGPVRATVAPPLLRDAAETAIPGSLLPTVGDWVAVGAGEAGPTIEGVLSRRSAFVRHATSNATGAHVLAANVDVVFIVVGLATPPNLSRIERMLTLAWESGAVPVVLLTKADLCDYLPDVLDAVGTATPGVAVHAVSAVTGAGLDALGEYLLPGRTLALLGASGVGKSTLVNRLLGAERLATGAIRDDGKGRHTTTHRELVPLPGGAVLVDTPGLRGVQLWDAAEGLDRAFADVEALAGRCRFRDCAHVSEPGCAVLAAVDDGTLDVRRVESHRKLERELRRLAAKQDARLRSAERNRWRAVARAQRSRPPRP